MLKNLSKSIALFVLLLSGCMEYDLRIKEQLDLNSSLIMTMNSYESPFPNPDSYSGRTELLPITTAPDFIWGVGGNPGTQEAYSGNVKSQFELLKELGVSKYRIAIPVNTDGSIKVENGIFAGIDSARYYSALSGIKLLPMIDGANPTDTISMTLANAYQLGVNIGYGFASLYKTWFDHVYELDNELDLVALVTPPGNSVIDYDASKMKWLGEYFRGMDTGIKQSDPLARTIINAAGHLHYSFFDILEAHTPNIDYDIVGWHWYDANLSELTMAYNGLDDHGKDIWITELNRKGGSLDLEAYPGTVVHHPGEQREQVRDFINFFHNKPLAKAIFYYELFDEPALEFGCGSPKPDHAFFGATSWTNLQPNGCHFNNYKQFDYKPVFDLYKFKIEESRFGYQDFVAALYKRCLAASEDRIQDAGVGVDNPIDFWASDLKTNGKASLVTNFLRGEHNNNFVRAEYLDLLEWNLPNDNSGVLYWTDRLNTGLPREEMISLFCSSDSFWSLAGSTNQGYVTRLFSVLLNRVPTQAESNQWVTKLNTGQTRLDLANEMQLLDEYARQIVREVFQETLGRPSDYGAGEDYWAALLVNGMSRSEVYERFLKSEEFWDNAIIDGYVRRNDFAF